MAYNFLPCDRNQAYLLPPSLTDWLPEDHLAWFVLDAVEQIDLSQFYKKYRTDGVGNSAFHPSMMVALLIYSYCSGERSSRKIEKHCQTDVAYKVVTANQYPDHSTISRFRKDNQSHLKKLFLEILRLCVEADIVKLGNVSLDGTKIKANASLSANRTLKHLEQEIDKMLSEADAKDAEEDKAYGADKRGDELPEDMRDRNSRINRLKACKERLEQEKAEAEKQQQDKIDERKSKEENTGKKPRGRKPKPAEEAGNKDAKANVTDPDSRIMKTRKGFVQGLNAQAVTTEQQIIVAEDVTQEENDKQQLHPMLEQAEENRQAVEIEEEMGVALADAGYCSEDNFTKEPAGDIELLVATQKDYKQRKAMAEQPPPEEPIPDGLSPTELMERKLLTERGRELYKIRGQTVEPVFGQIKDVRGFDRFMQRGIEACRGEWSLICATHNLLKLWRSKKACWN
ncbi:Transposase DDE domain protein [Sedimentisphaera cyanobacteriorum]|uniref:Transposase DDE domain protein n=1 Tax=Sedimentisphaera cyanobacteriorum TaxID=1940790 RepID=A0A1Q2HQV6_9BACT|nr:transposase [Sedimentisphaera cyanobacteriorum]AQQ08373.1 Transposase DDE domain protein [Sedimentisphaera cyanobacteriorum]AQQ08990.1 Transposase DDE domain protein [Sedimentisphaera cyanobacteriorum]AQQ09837.1 Transposase DDE domain protein [Sedimentisphaera cyanobacteriorum]AQQ10100.1 Transposase DDE domain protein [Sedimentisphaera cyanobacteriorum]